MAGIRTPNLPHARRTLKPIPPTPQSGNDNPQTSYDVPVRQPWELACFAQWFKDSSVISYVIFRTILRFAGPELSRERLPLNLEHVPPVLGGNTFTDN